MYARIIKHMAVKTLRYYPEIHLEKLRKITATYDRTVGNVVPQNIRLRCGKQVPDLLSNVSE
jgi:hypothetical protein